MRDWTCRRIHRLAQCLDRLGWWLHDPFLQRKKRAAIARESARIDGEDA